MSTILYKLIKDSGNGDQRAMMEIIEKFAPILKKYSKKLNYDGSDTDLVIALIETIVYLSRVNNNEINNREECIVGYISNSIKHKYIKLSKSHGNICRYESELNAVIEIADEEIIYNKDEYIFLNEMLDKLPSLQKRVIKERFLEEKSCSKIATELGISRQAVNNLKNRALKSLKAYIEIETINMERKGCC